MIIVPEIETVVILVPRTGSTALKNALLRRYPKAFRLYRHMEADGVPYGYDRWRRLGVCRDPLERLWSLYRFMRHMRQEPNWKEGYADRMNASAQKPFSEWLLTNETVFTQPFIPGGVKADGTPDYWPSHAIRHAQPENMKSQYVYLRPDLGTEVCPYFALSALENQLDVKLERENANDPLEPPTLTVDAFIHMQTVFAWDYAASRGLIK